MTEQQIRQLKKALDSSNAPSNSGDLDKRILQAANSKAELLKQPRTHRLFRLLSSNALGAAALSLVLTAGVFITLSQLIKKTDSQPYVTQSRELSIETDFGSDSIAALREGVIGSPGLSAPTDLSGMRDQILAQMILPNVHEVVNEMEFMLDADRGLAEQSVELAMNDIRSMIGQGRLDNARQRYEQLRQACAVCTLPSTLEALVMTALPTVDSS